MKSLIIIGAPRAGKTTLAKMVAQKLGAAGCVTSLISSDALMGGFQNMNKKFFVYSYLYRPTKHLIPGLRRRYHQVLLRQLSGFIAQYLPEQSQNSVVIYEGCHISAQLAQKLFPQDKFRIVAIGYPDATITQKMGAIRKYDKNTPASKRDDAQLHKYVQETIKTSKRLESDCKRYNVPFINTSDDYMGEIQKFVDSVPMFLK